MDHHRLVALLAATPIRLRRLTGDLRPGQALAPPKPGEWSIVEVLRHLVEGDRETFLPRLRRMVSEERPVFDSARRGEDAALDPGPLLDLFARARGEVTALIEALPPEGWAREGVSPSRGPLSIEAYSASMVEHDREHLQQIDQVRAALGLARRRCEARAPMPRLEILAVIRGTADRIVILAEGLDPAVLRRRPVLGAWSMKEVMAHLLKVERDVFLPRLIRLRDEEWPVFERFDPDAWAAERDHREGEFLADLDGFRACRAETVRLLSTLPEAGLDRLGLSATFGAVTLAEYATHVAEHDLEHLGQLEATRRALAG